MNNTTKRLPAQLKVSFWNCQGVQNKKLELQKFLEEYNIDVMLLSETFLKPGSRLAIANYKTYRNDRLLQPGGGTAILIKQNIEHHELPPQENLTFECNGITVNTKKQPISIWSAYCSPNETLDPNQISALFRSTKATILAGDLNAKNKIWNSKTNNTRGRILKQMADQQNIIITAPEDPTHIHTPNNTTEVLDIALLKNLSLEYDIATKHDLSSDHRPVMLTLGNGNDQDTYIKQTTNWNLYRKLCTLKPKLINTNADLENAVETLETHLLENLKKATTKAVLQKRPTTLPKEIINS